MTFRFGLRSQANLIGVHKDLQEVAYLALMLSPIDFAITDGVRSRAEQLELFETNKTKTMHSRHLTGHAIDVAALVDGKVTWDWKYYEDIATAFKAAAARLNIDLEWGGDWISFKDGPHFQLAYKSYPVPVGVPDLPEPTVAVTTVVIDDTTRARARAWVDSQKDKE